MRKFWTAIVKPLALARIRNFLTARDILPQNDLDVVVVVAVGFLT
jgi:hypothetical protein